LKKLLKLISLLALVGTLATGCAVNNISQGLQAISELPI
jgi:hypothetical protein